MPAPVVCKAHRHLANPAARRSIRREACIPKHARHRTDIDDPPVALRNHPARHCLRHKEAAAQIRLHHQVPIVPRHIQRGLAHIASSVVHQNVNLPEGCLRLARHALNALVVAHVEFQTHGSPPHRRDFLFKVVQRLALPARQHQVRARLRQRPRKVLPQPAARAGHHRHLPCQVKQILRHARASLFSALPGISTTFIRLGSCP